LRHRKTDTFHITKLKRTYNRLTSTFNFNVQYETTAKHPTKRTREVQAAFGLGTDSTQKFVILDNTDIKIRQGDMVLVTGDSGSGKSVLLRAIKQDLGDEAADIRELIINQTAPIVETVGKNTAEALGILSKVGLNDAFLFLRSYDQLSDGQKHHYQIALLAESDRKWWILDEFCSVLDRDTAKIVAFNLQRMAREKGATVIAATTHDDLTEDLAPNVTVHKRFGREIHIQYTPDNSASECSLTRDMQIHEGAYADYKLLSQFHYRSKHPPAPRKIFTLKRKNGELCGTIVYSYPSPFCFGRSTAWKGTLQQLMREVSVISRVIIHPKYRAISLGTRLVKETLPQAGTPYVEAVAVMARFNPFFEKAGMQRIAVSKPNENLTNALADLRKLGFNVDLLTSKDYCTTKLAEIGAENVVKILTELSRKGKIARKALLALPTAYPTHAAFTKKLDTLNQQQLAVVLQRLSFHMQPKVYLNWRKPYS
jgi:ABC-type lipoprotein export system ATPase subunit